MIHAIYRYNLIIYCISLYFGTSSKSFNLIHCSVIPLFQEEPRCFVKSLRDRLGIVRKKKERTKSKSLELTWVSYNFTVKTPTISHQLFFVSGRGQSVVCFPCAFSRFFLSADTGGKPPSWEARPCQKSMKSLRVIRDAWTDPRWSWQGGDDGLAWRGFFFGGRVFFCRKSRSFMAKKDASIWGSLKFLGWLFLHKMPLIWWEMWLDTHHVFL